jgi:hypothetical protein
MNDSTRLSRAFPECAAQVPPERLVEDECCGGAAEALEHAVAQAWKWYSHAWACSCDVVFECEQVFAGPEHRRDALADPGEVEACSGFIFAAWADDRGVQFAHLERKFPAGVTLVAEQCLAAVTATTVQSII